MYSGQQVPDNIQKPQTEWHKYKSRNTKLNF